VKSCEEPTNTSRATKAIGTLTNASPPAHDCIQPCSCQSITGGAQQGCWSSMARQKSCSKESTPLMRLHGQTHENRPHAAGLPSKLNTSFINTLRRFKPLYKSNHATKLCVITSDSPCCYMPGTPLWAGGSHHSSCVCCVVLGFQHSHMHTSPVALHSCRAAQPAHFFLDLLSTFWLSHFPLCFTRLGWPG